MADEAERREWKRLCDEDVFDDGEGDAEEVPKNEGGHAHDSRGSSQGGELAGGKAEHDLLAVVVNLFGNPRLECHRESSFALGGAADALGKLLGADEGDDDGNGIHRGDRQQPDDGVRDGKAPALQNGPDDAGEQLHHQEDERP